MELLSDTSLDTGTAPSTGTLSKQSSFGMDMDSLTASMSRVLLRGDRYTAPPNIRRLKLEEVWHWQASSSHSDCPKYLDASVLLFGPERTFLGSIDFSDRENAAKVGSVRAVVHSGDKLRKELRQGRHSIDVDLGRLGAHVREIYVTMSAYDGANLEDFQYQAIGLLDCDTGQCLCEYHLERQPKEELQNRTSVIMAKIYRTRESNWEVEALGQLGQGSALNYGPMLKHITETQKMDDMLSAFRL